MADENVRIVVTAVDKTRNGLTKVAGSLGSVTRALVSMRTGLVAVVGTAGLGLLVRQSLNATDALAKTAGRIGTTTEALSRLQFAASISGVETNTLNMALQRFVRRTAEAAQGTGEAVTALRELGIDAREIQKLPLDERMQKLAVAFGQVTNESEQLRLAFKLFDSEGTAVVNLLAEGSDGLREMYKEAQELGIVMSGDAARRVEEASDAFTRLNTIAQGLTRQFTAALAPALTILSEAFKNYILEQSRAHGGIENFSRYLAGGFIDGIRSALIGLQELTNAGIDVINTFSSARKTLSAVFAIGKADPNDVAALKKELAEIDQALKGGFFNDLGKIRLFSDGAVIDILTDEELLAERERIVKQLEGLGVDINEAIPYVNFADRLAVPLAEAAEAAKAPIENLKNTISEVAVVAKEPWYMPMINGLRNFAEALDDVSNKIVLMVELEKFAASTMDSFTQGFTDAITGAKNFKDAIKDMARSIINDLIRMLVQYYITQAVFGAITTGIGNLFPTAAPTPTGGGVATPKMAVGGPVSTGRPYIVGENGPELFVPSASGSIQPNGRMNAGGITINQSVNFSTGITNTVRAEVLNLMPQIQEATKAAVANSRQRGGSFSKAMAGA